MADRTAAALFEMIFRHLAEHPDERSKVFARLIWNETGGYDFSPYQMGADDALVALGLARRLDCGCLIYDGEEHDDRDCERPGTAKGRTT